MAEPAVRQVASPQDEAVVLLSPQGVIESWDSGAERLWQCSAAEVIGQHFSLFYTPEERDTKPVEHLQLAALHGRFSGSCWRLRKDGSRLWAQVAITALKDGTGKHTGYCEITRDLPAAEAAVQRPQESPPRNQSPHRAEAQVRRSERWFAGTLRSIGDGIIAVDNNLSVLFINAAAQTLTGWTETEAGRRPLRDVFRLVDARTGDPLEDAINRSLRQSPSDSAPPESTGSTAIDAMLVSRFDVRIPVEETASPILDDAGNVVGGVLVFRDVSLRKQAEEAKRASEEQLRTLANSIAQLAWMAEPDGTIFWYNQRWYEYTGTTPEEMFGWGWQSVHDPEILPEVLSRWRESLDTGKPLDMEFPLRAAGGEYRWFLTRVVPVRDSTGEIVRWFGTNTDIDEARTIREQLKRANASLAQFAYSVSHDLREPLRNVAIYAELLSREHAEELGSQRMEYLGYISEGASRTEALVRDLLTYAECGETSDAPLVAVDAGARAARSHRRAQHGHRPERRAGHRRRSPRGQGPRQASGPVVSEPRGQRHQVHLREDAGDSRFRRGRWLGMGLLRKRQRHRHRPEISAEGVRPF